MPLAGLFEMKFETWRDIPNFNGYQVSDHGRVKSLCRQVVGKNLISHGVGERILIHEVNDQGYHRVSLSVNNRVKRYRVHQLVAMAFLGHTPCGYEIVVNHKNFKRDDNWVENLELVTQRENCNKKHIKSSSQYVGVSFDKARNKWKAAIAFRGEKINLGRYVCEAEASAAYQKALNEIHTTNRLTFPAIGED